MDRVINFTDQEPDWDKFSPAVQKIVLGASPGEFGQTRKFLTIQALPEDLANRFPKLTHLYLWGLASLGTLPTLPPGLQCLDLRGCADLQSLPRLPEKLTTLVLDGCGKLDQLTSLERSTFPQLLDLSLQGCRSLPEECVQALIRNSPSLRLWNASGCPQLTEVPELPSQLVDLRLNDCPALAALPAEWPAQLRRLELKGAVALTTLPDLPDFLDYVDLSGMENLRQLPAKRGRPRTLFLFGAGLLMPPASELGEQPGDNVAAATEAYFQDVALTGQGEVKRCKLLVLGNGGAGKTCLSLALATQRDPAEAEDLGSTHGVQFWPWEKGKFTAKLAGKMQSAQLQVWDFGGQEIYHNTHQLFMGKGAVFIVVWHPEQDGRVAPPTKNGYADEWRPLQYWLDFIHESCPHRPRIAIVCSHHAEGTPALEQQWRDQVRPEFHKECRCFYLDSRARPGRQGQLFDLEKWLREAVGAVVESQGVAVPSYWEIAQDMVEAWVKRLPTDPEFALSHNQLSLSKFQEELELAIQNALATDSKSKYAQLATAIQSGRFQLTTDRLTRTLSFLTHSGWVYWNEKLFEGRVIIGQEWALKGLYTILNRREDSPIYRHLAEQRGRFTLRELGEWAWNKVPYSTTEQELLLSFMARCGLCFQLLSRTNSWREADVYASFEHLPVEAKEGRLQAEFTRRRPGRPEASDTIESNRMHKLHWQKFLIDAGAHYGASAQYARDAFYVENAEGDKILVLCHLNPKGLGGTIELRVGGEKPAERLETMKTQLQSFLPGSELSSPPPTTQNIGGRREKIRVAISYARDPADSDPGVGKAAPYEEPADAIEKFLCRQSVVVFRRDKKLTEFGADLREFMLDFGKDDHVILLHSDKYWRSPYCIFELWAVNRSLGMSPEKSLLQELIPIEHLNSGIRTVGGRDKILAYWKNYDADETPTTLGWDGEKLKAHAQSLVHEFADALGRLLNLNLKWSDGKDEVLAAIAKPLKLPEEGDDRAE